MRFSITTGNWAHLDTSTYQIGSLVPSPHEESSGERVRERGNLMDFAAFPSNPSPRPSPRASLRGEGEDLRSVRVSRCAPVNCFVTTSASGNPEGVLDISPGLVRLMEGLPGVHAANQIITFSRSEASLRAYRLSGNRPNIDSTVFKMFPNLCFLDSGTLSGCEGLYDLFRGCRFAQPPANFCSPSGAKIRRAPSLPDPDSPL
jgi:hypothetical protein